MPAVRHPPVTYKPYKPSLIPQQSSSGCRCLAIPEIPAGQHSSSAVHNRL